MIYITGDTHGDIDFNKLIDFVKENKNLSRKDYLIIAGDFGGVWQEDILEKTLKPYKNLPFTVLFVDGNHENFDLLDQYKVEEWNGGKIHKIADNIIHLMRGQLFTIEGKTFLTIGGADSVDKAYRKEHISWWTQEKVTQKDINEAFKNLKKVNNKVDYIITHTCDKNALEHYPLHSIYCSFKCREENILLSQIEANVKYKHWYFGHYHIDGDISEKKTVLYDTIVRII